MKKYIFPILVALAALSLAGAAAFFSITGLSKLFGGARTEVIIMASALEFAKLVTASFLHRYWKTLPGAMKVYLSIGVITVMIITSLGIYGFLSNAYSTTSGKLQNLDAQIELVGQKKTIVTSEISRIQESKDLKSSRVKSLTDLRSKQETRVDSLYNRKQSSTAKRVENQIEQANKEMILVNVEIDTLNNQIQRKYAEISKLDMEVLDLKNSDVNGEVGPLKYIAKLTGKDMDSVVNIFIMLLIFVFDPLAVSLVIATNISIEKEFGEKSKIEIEIKQPEKKEDDVPAEEEINLVEKVEQKNVSEQEVEKSEQEEVSKEDIEIVEEEVPASLEREEILKQIAELEEIKIKEQIEVEKKTNEDIQYIADESGEFKASKVSDIDENKSSAEIALIVDQIKAEGMENNANYDSFLYVLFNYGKSYIDEKLPTYSKFLEQLSSAGLIKIKYSTEENGDIKIYVEDNREQEVKDFLTICNLSKITDMSGPGKKIAREYGISKEIISKLTK